MIEPAEALTLEERAQERAFAKIANYFGELLDYLVVPHIEEKFRALNFTIEQISQNLKIVVKGQCIAEVDIILENSDTVIAVEVIEKLLKEHVDEHVNRMEVLRRKADARNDTKKFRGAIAGAIMNAPVRNYAHKAGFYVIEQTGDTVKINIPEGFTPREW